MKRLISVGLFVGMLGSVSVVFATSCMDAAADAATEAKGAVASAAPVAGAEASKPAVEVGNTVCPVMGTPIDPKSKITVEHEGKVYNLCCPGCVAEFKKDPARFIKKLEDPAVNGAHAH
jgi:YHS domain-containing protein